jgi:CheY-like chemotaxis protein
MNAKKKILLVEDEYLLGQLLKLELEGAGFEVIAVEQGVDAIKQLDECKIDAVVTDLFMPEMDGGELLKRMQEKGHDQPVIFLSATKDKAIIESIKALGANHFIEKPVDDEKLAYLFELINQS